MGILVIILLVLSAAVLIASRRNAETILISALNLSLAEFWGIMLIYIAKKGGFSVQIQTMLFGTRAIRLKLQYLIFTLGQLGYVMAIGRYLFPLFLLWLSVYYCMRIPAEKKAFFYILFSVFPIFSLIIYIPSIFKWIIKLNGQMIAFLVNGSLIGVIACLAASIAMLLIELHDTTMRFYKRQFAGRVIMIISLVILYGLYCPQDPAQVYLFYQNEYMGSQQGLWYLNPALNRFTYLLVFILVIICTAIGVYSTLRYARENILEGLEETAIRRKFDAASKGASVFVHSVKNQLLVNRVLLKRTGAELEKETPDLEVLRAHYQQLSQNNNFMIERMEELYRCIRTNSIMLVEENLKAVCERGIEQLLNKYPGAKVECKVPDHVTILCDKNYLSEAMYNLLLNGWEAQTAAEHSDQTMLLEGHEERMWIVVEITDHGIGLSEEQRRHMFEPFWSSKNSNYNWGMGLYYARQIIKNHFGVMRIETALGKGTTFVIQLPKYETISRK